MKNEYIGYYLLLDCDENVSSVTNGNRGNV